MAFTCSAMTESAGRGEERGLLRTGAPARGRQPARSFERRAARRRGARPGPEDQDHDKCTPHFENKSNKRHNLIQWRLVEVLLCTPFTRRLTPVRGQA